MSNHQFKLGDVVEFASLFASKVATSSYEVIRLLPSEGQEPAYRIKNKAEQYERAVKEHEITRARA
jgi:hypothetical protein